MKRASRVLPVPVVLVTGTIGAGKSAVSEEISVILHERGKQHALIETDGIAQCYPGTPDDPFNTELAFDNLAALWPNFLAREIEYGVLAHTIERASEVVEIRAALPEAIVTVVRVMASPRVCAERIRAREISGGILERHLRRSPLLDRNLDDLEIEDFRVSNEDRPIRDVGLEVIELMGWDAASGPKSGARRLEIVKDTGRKQEESEDSRADDRPAEQDDADSNPPLEDEVDEASDQSFPASDPPAY